jgi:hypothetical protein
MLGSPIEFWLPGGGDSYIINDRITYPELWSADPFYFISVSSVDGLTNADISYESHPIPNATGEKSGDVFRRGKTITLTGKINALSLIYLEQGVDYLTEMFRDLDLRKISFIRLADAQEVYYTVRVNQDLTIVKSVESGKYEYDWVVGLRADNPFTYLLSDDSLYPTWQVD